MKIVERDFGTHKIRFIHADNMEWMKNHVCSTYDLAIVDPPYGIGAGKNGFSTVGNNADGLATRKDYGAKDWDNAIPGPEYFELLMKSSKNQIIWGGNYFIDHLYNTSCMIVWDKDNGEWSNADCELAWTSFKTAVRKFKWLWNGMLQQNMKKKQERIHPTEKPIELYEWLLMKYAKPGQTILDTHGGSGSIAIACHRMKFDLDIVELDEEYFENMIKRFDEQPESRRIEKDGKVSTEVQTNIFDQGA